MKRRRKKSKIGKTGCLFWLLILLIVIIIFLYKGKGSFKDTISYFRNIINKGKTEEVSKKEIVSIKNQELKPTEKNKKLAPNNEANQEVKKQETKKIKTPRKKPVAPLSQSTKKNKESIKKTSSITKTKTFITPVYFIKIEINGSAKPYPINRKVQFKDSPVTMTIKTLLSGPTPSERKKGIISFIPKGTRLLSASIKNGNLILNFNDSLEENYSGRDAIMLELLQILYTCFEFDTVKSVSILINGKRKQYLTGEGIPLKSKYYRSDLSKIWS